MLDFHFVRCPASPLCNEYLMTMFFFTSLPPSRLRLVWYGSDEYNGLVSTEFPRGTTNEESWE